MYRPIIGFVVAALAVPIFYAVVAYRATTSNDTGYAILVAGSTVFSCVVTLFLGAPAYLFLQAKKWTAFWIAPLVGFIVAIVPWFVFNLLLGLVLVPDPSYVLSHLTDIDSLEGILWPIGPLGAVAGVLLWLIASPDRSHD
jgi:hypothetical protein